MRTAARRWKHALPWIALVCVIVGCAMAIYTTLYESDFYRAVYTLHALPDLPETERSPLESARMLARDAHVLTESDAFRQTVLRTARSDGRSYVQVKGIDGTHMMEVIVTGPDARLIAELANAIGCELCVQLPSALGARSTGEVEPAREAESPAGPRRVVKTVAAALCVFVAASLLSCLIVSDRAPLCFDDAKAEAFRLGAIADTRRDVRRFLKRSKKQAHSGTVLTTVNRLIRENVRRAALSLRTIRPEIDGRCVLTAAAKQDEESPVFAALLSGELAQQGFRVLMINLDSGEDRLSRLLGVKPRADLYDYLMNRAEMDEMMLRTPIQTLAFIDNLHPEIPVADFAATQTFADFLSSAKSHFDFVILYARDMSCASDAAMLSLLADGTLLTAHDGRMTAEEIDSAARTLATIGKPARGVVFTGVKPEKLMQDE